jgi:hypothetical protein
MNTTHGVNEVSNFRLPPGDRLVERDGLVLGDGVEPFHDLEVAATRQTPVHE